MKKIMFLLIWLLIIFLSSCSVNMEMKNPFKQSKSGSLNFVKITEK